MLVMMIEDEKEVVAMVVLIKSDGSKKDMCLTHTPPTSYTPTPPPTRSTPNIPHPPPTSSILTSSTPTPTSSILIPSISTITASPTRLNLNLQPPNGPLWFQMGMILLQTSRHNDFFNHVTRAAVGRGAGGSSRSAGHASEGVRAVQGGLCKSSPTLGVKGARPRQAGSRDTVSRSRSRTRDDYQLDRYTVPSADHDRLRAPNFSRYEVEMLIELVEKYKHIIENKKTDGVSLKEKDATWQKIAEEFSHLPVDVETQLYEYYKRYKWQQENKNYLMLIFIIYMTSVYFNSSLHFSTVMITPAIGHLQNTNKRRQDQQQPVLKMPTAGGNMLTRLRVFENNVLRKIFGAKRDEGTGEWRKLHNTELHALYSSPNIIRNIKSRRLRWAGHVARMGESRNAYRVLVGRPEGKRPLGRPRRRWEGNIKIDLREVGYDDRD
ncbi:hypothetical protein ANN_23535 [Periplaneta americana]|uniref:Regulatory protein zeste n=1 Tax=Periplaneta americana TaxID=6978 RepID=A0ABQ8SLS8_PERAM|nr:hypothetical protein ANN_23535 [Periplaneta americana]